MDLNQTQAAVRAGYSPKTANEQGSQLLANLSVRAAVDAGMDKRAAKLELKADDVLRELHAIAMADIDSDLRYDHKLKALELLGKHLKLFTEKHDHIHNFDGQTDEQLEARYRALVARATATVIGGES